MRGKREAQGDTVPVGILFDWRATKGEGGS